MSHEFKIGDRVSFTKQSVSGASRKIGRIIHDHGNGMLNIDTNHPHIRTKSYPSTVHHTKLTKV